MIARPRHGASYPLAAFGLSWGLASPIPPPSTSEGAGPRPLFVADRPSAPE